jgi:hypothetical protein
MDARILYHSNCFDGCASAALLGRFLQARLGSRLGAIEHVPLQHQAGNPIPPDAFSADVNAIVDFRYSPSPRLDWWFDHHQSAFQPASDRAHFEADHSGQRFWDPAAPSCTGFIARVTRERFGFEAADLAELVRWADVIDAAAFPSAEVAVQLAEPALRIMTFLEATRDPAAPGKLIEAMRTRTLAEVAALPWLAGPLAPVLERHFRSIEAIRAASRLDGDVAVVDLAAAGLEAGNKFVLYWLHPGARYTVTVSHDAKRSKVSVGSNPWARETRAHDLARICERYGGGGHPVVGAVSLPPEDLARAREIAREIVRELQGGAPQTSVRGG